MKNKVILFLVALFVLMVFNNNPVNADEDIQIQNLLDLKNLRMYRRDPTEGERSEMKFVTVHPIAVHPGNTYTLVVDQEFYDGQEWTEGQHEPYYPNLVIFMYNRGKPGHGITVEVEPIRTNDKIYFTFEVNHDQLEFVEIPVADRRRKLNKIVLFKGTIADFSSYVSYKSSYLINKGVYIMDYDNRKTLEEVLLEFTFTDNVDDDVIIDVLENNYNYELDQLGLFDVYFSVSDKSSNKIFFNLRIHVVDIVPPTLWGLEVIEAIVGEKISVEQIQYDLRISDNHTKLNNGQIEIVEDNYTPNYNQVGNFDITFKVQDESENTTYFTTTIANIDNVKPVIEGPIEIFRYLGEEKLTLDDFKNLYSAYDNIDGDLTDNIQILDDYNENKVGNYKMYVQVIDSSNNEAKYKFYVNVVDGTPPTYTTSDLILTYSQHNSMNQQDIVDWLTSVHEQAGNITILYNEADYIEDHSEICYIYYSYTIDDQIYYSKIAVEPESYSQFKNIIIYSLLVIINGAFIITYVLRRRKLITYL